MQKKSLYILPNDEILAQIENYASMKFSISEIATLLHLDYEQLRRQIAAPADPIRSAYEAGKLKGQLKYREKIRLKAEEGEVWAISILERWEKKQLEEELGVYA